MNDDEAGDAMQALKWHKVYNFATELAEEGGVYNDLVYLCNGDVDFSTSAVTTYWGRAAVAAHILDLRRRGASKHPLILGSTQGSIHARTTGCFVGAVS